MDIKAFVDGLEGRKNLSEDEVKGLLSHYDIPTTRFSVVLPEQVFNVGELEYPLVMKVASPEILHKTEVGGVILGIKDKDEAESAFISLRTQFPQKKILIESMELPGIEIIAGMIRDDSFGLSIMVGLGGIFTEVLKDVSFRVVPITRYDAIRMIEDLSAAKVLDGFRGTKVDRDILIDILLKLSKLGENFDPYLKEMDLNPIILREKNAVVVDAKMQLI
jgi:acyl-CoA synthetase (NDP forming)